MAVLSPSTGKARFPADRIVPGERVPKHQKKQTEKKKMKKALRPNWINDKSKNVTV